MAQPPASTRPDPSRDKGTTSNEETEKVESLDPFRADATGHALTTNQGVRIADNQNSLRAGARGPTLLEDFIMREKITHFDHERIPERIVHARGSAAHGYFQVYESMAEYSKAAFLQDPEKITPVYVRFSTVGGSRGSADTPRDVRGFAVKFYTDEGNYDLVGNNMPVFFIQDAIKFPDFVHAVKPEPHNEIPQASSAHDTFWDFVSLVPETTHTVMWLMSDRALPRSLRTMEGFGVHTFRLVNAQGKGRFVKFHWRPVAGAYSLLWDEAQKLAGKDADFNRRDLWESIENGQYPEFELGVQIVEEADEHKFEFDLLDPTKLIPEELVPVKIIGKMTLNRNPDSFFAETEQVAFHPGHVVPGIDFTNDPLLQGRLFSYTDTQISRLGGPNFHEIPINRAVVPMHNNQRDAMHRQTINVGQASYEPNSIADGWPKQTPPAAAQGGYESYAEKVDGTKIRVRSESFDDHYSQATMFWNSMAPHEKDHIVSAFQFELGKLTRPYLRERMVANLANVDADLAGRVASGLGLQAPKPSVPLKTGVATQGSPALSLANKTKDSIRSRKVAILAAPGADGAAIEAIKALLNKQGAHAMVIAPMLGSIGKGKGQDVMADATVAAMPSIMFDAVFVPGGADSIAALSASGDARHFLLEAYKHLKAIAVVGEGRQLLTAAHLPEGGDEGLVVGDSADGVAAAFFKAIGKHRVWAREAKAASVPA